MESNKSDVNKSSFIETECHDFESVPDIETFTNMDLDVFESQELGNEITSLLNDNISNVTDTVKNSNCTSILEIEAEIDESNTGNDKPDKPDKLTCDECGEVVELLNNNVTFSLEVHAQIHKQMSETKDSSSPMISYSKNSDYMCTDCNKVITVFNNDINLSLQHHFSTCQPKGQITPEIRIIMNQKFIDDVFFCLGDAFKTDIPYVVFEGGSLFCKVCKCSIATSEDIFNTSISLRNHLSLLYHKDLLSLLQGNEKTIASPKKPSKKMNKSQCGNENQGGKLTQDELKKLSSLFSKMSLKNSESSEAVNDDSNGNMAEQLKTSFEVSLFFKNCPERYKIHQEFFSSSQKSLHCNICDCYVEPSETNLKSHIVNISHKIEFFKKIKEQIKEEDKPHLKFLIIVDNKLFCSHCKALVTELISLKSVCKGVVEHFQNYSHSG